MHRTSFKLNLRPALQKQIAYSDRFTDNLTTLSTNYAPSDGTVQGLLYVPDLDPADDCSERAAQYIPANATRQTNLPPTSYNLIALAPWIDSGCTRSLLASTQADQLRAFIFYLPNNDTSKPPEASDSIWSLDDDSSNSWMSQYHYPIYVVPGAKGNDMMHELSLYSGSLSTVPYGDQIEQLYSADSEDYVRIWTELRVSYDSPMLPLWAWVLIIGGVVLMIIAASSVLMHAIQRHRRSSLRRRVMRGEIDLEGLGIKRVTVPHQHIMQFPLFTYNYDPPGSPTSLQSPGSPSSANWKIPRPTSHFESGKLNLSTDYQPMCQICLDHYESKVTVIRELSCGHIFHPECIDEFLVEISSLCPVCKKSMLPKGYSPPITNGMVRRERATRRLRPRITTEPDLEASHPKVILLESTSQQTTQQQTPASMPGSPAPAKVENIELSERPNDPETTRQRMQDLAGPIDDRSDDGRPACKLTTFHQDV